MSWNFDFILLLNEVSVSHFSCSAFATNWEIRYMEWVILIFSAPILAFFHFHINFTILDVISLVSYETNSVDGEKTCA